MKQNNDELIAAMVSVIITAILGCFLVWIYTQ